MLSETGTPQHHAAFPAFSGRRVALVGAACVGLCAVGAVAAMLRHGGRMEASALTEWAIVGDANNAADTTGFGAVPYAYRIGRFEVTIGQYVEFLNAVAADDPFGLFHPGMEANLNVAGIRRCGTPGSFAYEVLTNGGHAARRPITLVSWFDAARYANWVANGRPRGAPDTSTTEDGAYTLLGVVDGHAVPRNAINPNTGRPPECWLPTEDEWYKAAYFNPLLDEGRGGYTAFATQSDQPPGNRPGDDANQANFRAHGFAAQTATAYDEFSNYLTEVGSFRASASFYGTHDQSGNVWEWNDLDGGDTSVRGARGGFWGSTPAAALSSAIRCTYAPHTEDFQFIGFRLAGPVTPALLQDDAVVMSRGWQRLVWR